MTSPPLLSYIGVKVARLKNMKFVYWAMDLQPELSLVANYLKEGSFAARILQKRGDFIFKNADKIVALDKFMQYHIVTRGAIPINKVDIIPVWPVLSKNFEGERLRNPFRLQNGFGDKTVIMYSGNHSVMHPLTTLLEAAIVLKDDPRFLFVHIGSGVNLKEVSLYKDLHSLNNIVILPYQPRESIHISLASADIQVVSLGNGCVGFNNAEGV